MQVAALNATIDAMMLADLGIQYNVSDSDADSDSGGGTVAASLTIDFVQRFNFSVAEDSTISFLSPQAGTQGYVPMLVFDNAGASTVLAESIFYTLKARPLGAVVCVQTAAHSLETSCNSALTCSGASLDCAVPPDRMVRERRGLHTVPKGAVRLCLPLGLADRLRHLRSEPCDPPRRIRGDRCRSWAGRNVSRRFPYVAARRVLE